MSGGGEHTKAPVSNGVPHRMWQRRHRIARALILCIVAFAAGLQACGGPPPPPPPPPSDDPIDLLQSQEVGFGAIGRFQVGHDGSANYTIPLIVPRGRRGVEPMMSLAYNSNRPDVGVGVGWSVTGASAISRCRRTPGLDGAAGRIEFDSLDALCMDGRRLVHVGGGQPALDGAEYRPQRDGLELVILHGRLSDADSWFEVRLPDGGGLEFGNSSAGNSLVRGVRFRSELDGLPVRIGEVTKRWLISRRRDLVGNFMTYSYIHGLDVTDSQRMGYETYLSRIDYTGHASLGTGQRSVRFFYAPASSAESGRYDYYENGFWEYSSRPLERIEMWAPGEPEVIRSYRFEYDASRHTSRRLLTSVSLCDGFGACLAPTGFSYTANATPEVTFDVESLGPVPRGWYSRFATGDDKDSLCALQYAQAFTLADFDGSGGDDLLYFEQSGSCAGGQGATYEYRVRMNSAVGPDTLGPPFPAGIPATRSAFPVPPELPRLVVLDINGDGRTDVFDTRTVPGQLGVRYIRREWNGVMGGFDPIDEDLFGCAAPMTGPVIPFLGGRVDVLATLLVGDVDGNGSPDLLAGCTPPCGVETSACSIDSECCPGMLCTAGTCSIPSVDVCGFSGDRCGRSGSCCRGLDCEGRVGPLDGYCVPPLPQAHWVARRQEDIAGASHDSFADPSAFFVGEQSSSSAILSDFGGVGRVQMLLAANPSDTHYSAGSIEASSGAISLAPTNVPVSPLSMLVYIDMNGDGLRDVLDLAGEDGAQIRLNSGRGLIEPMDAYLPVVGGSIPANLYEGRRASDVRVADFNGDGREDFLLLSEGVLEEAGDSSFVLHYATGAGFVRYASTSFDAEPAYVPAAGGEIRTFRSWNTVQLGDLNGDSELDIVAANHTSLTAYYSRHVRPDLLETVTLADAPYDDRAYLRVHYANVNSNRRIRSRPAGEPSRILYSAYTLNQDWPLRRLYKGLTVVERHSEVATTDETLTDPVHLANQEALISAHFEYSYTGGAVDTQDGSFLGFASRRMVRWEAIAADPPSSGWPWTRRDWTETRWEFDIETRAADGLVAFAGMPVAIERRVLHPIDGRYHAERTNFHLDAVQPAAINPPGTPPIVFRRVGWSQSYGYDLPEAPPDDSLADSPSYASRLTTHVQYDDYSIPTRWIRVTEGGEIVTTTSIPDRDLSINLLQRYGRTTITSQAGGTNATREVTYDYHPASRLLAQMTTNPTDGRRLRVTAYAYTDTGVIDHIDERAWNPDFPLSAAALRRSAHIVYGSEELYPRAIGVDVDGTTLWSTFEFQPALGVLQRSSGPDGATAEAYHDGFGRVRRVVAAGGSETTYDYSPPSSAYDQVVLQTAGNDGSRTENTYDAFGRVRRSRVLSDQPGVWWTQVWRFDGRGFLTEVSLPHEEGSAPVLSRYRRDDLGRLSETVTPDGASTVAVHGAIDPATGDYDPLRVETTTPRGNTYVHTFDADMRLRAYLEPGGARTSYEYGPFGLPQRVDLPDGAFRQFTYDSNGLLSSVEDSAVGLRTTERDGLGELFRVTHADGSTVDLRYDGAGRLIRRWSTDGVARFVYDVAANGRGRLAYSVSEDGTRQELKYNTAGRVTEVMTTAPGVGVMRAQYGYSAVNGQLDAQRVAGPAGGLVGGVELRYGYRNGYLSDVSSPDAGPIWEAEAYHPQGYVERERYPASDLVVDRDLDTSDRQVGFRSSVYSVDVQLDEDGNVVAVSDDRVAQEFSYDQRGRLEAWQWNGLARASYEYDDLGNVELSESATLTYDPTTHLLSTIDGAAVHHDLRGRLDEISGRNVSWRDFDLFGEVQDTSTGQTVSYSYTADQRRAGWLSSTGGSSIQMGDGMYRRDESEEGVVTETYRVRGATRVVAELVSEDGSVPEMRFLHDDHLGSTAATSGAAGVAEERFWHSPFGRRVAPETGEFLDASEDFDVRPRFASHVTDGQAPNLGTFGAGFVHMRGREYDPVIGRFLSQDPMTPVGIDSSGWNPYAYVLNNPSTLIDPSGFGPFDVLEDSVTSATSSLDLVNQGVALQYLTAAWRVRPAIAHLQVDADFNMGLLSGLGVPWMQPGSFGDNVSRERAFYNGQLIGSAIGIAADLLMVASGAMLMYTGELPAVLLGLLGSVIGPEGGVGGAAVGAIVGVPVFVVGLGLVFTAGGAMPFHVLNLNDAISNLRRMERAGSGGSRRVSVGGRPWRAHRVGEAACQRGCEAAAESIQASIGGEVRVIRPRGGTMLGPMRDAGGTAFRNPAGGTARGWEAHHVVVREGRVYDALTGPGGEAIDAYKARFQYADAIDFGF